MLSFHKMEHQANILNTPWFAQSPRMDQPTTNVTAAAVASTNLVPIPTGGSLTPPLDEDFPSSSGEENVAPNDFAEQQHGESNFEDSDYFTIGEDHLSFRNKIVTPKNLFYQKFYPKSRNLSVNHGPPSSPPQIPAKFQQSDFCDSTLVQLHHQQQQQQHQIHLNKQQLNFNKLSKSSSVLSNLSSDPRTWMREDVQNWIRCMCELHGLPPVQLDRFLMNGKALCLMTMDMFCQRVPLGGKMLYKDFQLRLSMAMYKQRLQEFHHLQHQPHHHDEDMN